MNDNAPRSQRPNLKRTTTTSSSAMQTPSSLVAMVKEKIVSDPLWNHFSRSGAWICPYCLSAVRSHEDTRSALVRSIEGHLSRRCPTYRGGTGFPQTTEVIQAKQNYEDIAHLAATDPAWQVFDHEGYWYSPCSLRRVQAVRISNGRFDSFTIQNMVNTLSACEFFKQGTVHRADAVQRARDQWLRAVNLTTNIRQLVQFSLWRYTNTAGEWVCPFCLSAVRDLILRADSDWREAPERMAQHLAFNCQAYVPERPEPKAEASVQKASHNPAGPLPAPALPFQDATKSTSVLRRTPSSTSIFARETPGTAPIPAPTANPPATQNPHAVPTTRMTGRSVPHSERFINPAGMGAPPPIARPVSRENPGTARQSTRIIRTLGPVTTPIQPPRDTSSDIFMGSILDQLKTPLPESEKERTGAVLDWMDAVEKLFPDGKQAEPEPEDDERMRARAVQQSLLQTSPEIPGFRFATRFEACSDVSGDFYEFIRLPDGRLGFAQGDVSGHGIHAALIMSMAKKTLAIYASAGAGPSETLAKVNDSLVDDLGGKIFISMVYGILDPNLNVITWSRAGHNPVIRYNTKTGNLAEIKPKGMVVGMKAGNVFRNSLEEQQTELESGDLFVIYTDGITETMNRQQVEYGVELLMEVVRKHAENGPDNLNKYIMDSVRQFRGGVSAADDSTLLTLAVD
jgi:serine phosphatase RsbU (regulator of sigma subunit)